MKRSTQIIIAVLVLIIVPIVYYTHRRLVAETLVGCYIARMDKSVYTLTIQSHNLTSVRGILSYKNYQMDSSAGTFEGTYLNGILLGDYSSRAEGSDFISQLSFKKEGDTFYQGEGKTQLQGNRSVFVNPGDISYENGNAFKKDESCNK